MLQILTHINNIPIQRNFVEHLPFNSTLKQLAKDKRKAGILSEVLFWKEVRNKQFHRIDFDRQRIIGNYIVDFYVKALGLIVEVDGESHDDKVDYDARRDEYFKTLGLAVFHVSNGDIRKNILLVLTELEDFIIRDYGLPPTPTSEEN
jgi:Uncharacterized protein conserved in bacteria